MNISDLINGFAGRYANTKIIRNSLLPFYRLYKYFAKDKSIKELQSNFEKNGLLAIKKFDECMSENSFKYSLAFGSMLGAVREKGFISHDLDIDTLMWINDYSPKVRECLEKSGFKLVHSYSIDDDRYGKEETYSYEGVQIDIFFFYPPFDNRKYPYCCDFFPFPECRTVNNSIKKYGGLLPRRLELPLSNEFVRTQFENLELPIPSNAHEFLSLRYGEDYMTPNPQWVNKKNENIVIWNEKLAKFYEFK